MKKVLLIMLMAVTSMMASADVGEWSLGGQFVFGTEGSMPGVWFEVPEQLFPRLALGRFGQLLLQEERRVLL